MSGGAALAAVGRCLTGGLSGCLLPAAGLGSLGLLLLILLLLAGASQTLGAASVGLAPPPQPHYQHTVHAAYSQPAHNYQLAVFGPDWTQPPPPRQPQSYKQYFTTAYTVQPTTVLTAVPILANDTYAVYVRPDGGLSYGGRSGASTAAPELQLDYGLPELSLEYGLPAPDFLTAQASVSASTQRPPDSKPQQKAAGHNTTLPLLDVIPAQGGEDYPDDGCARDEVLMSRPHRSYSHWRRCQPLLQQGDCPAAQWVIVNSYTKLGECATRLCPEGYVFLASDGLCHDVGQSGICPGNRRLFLTAFADARCGCPDGQYLDTEGTCRTVYSSDSCHYHQQLRFNTAFRLQCMPSACPREKPVNFQGWCKAFGDPCGDYHFILAFDTTLLEPRCFPADEVTGAGSLPRGTQPPHEVPAAFTTTTTTTTATVMTTTTSAAPATLRPVETPHLFDSYLPPPGQFTQYARRQGLWDVAWGRGRSSLAQWLGLSRRRGRPRRRRPHQQPQPQPQSPLLDPWSRLDIDQVTFVDSERVSSAELQRHGRRRYRRQIVAKVPLLNSCRPGKRNGPNFKCRSKLLPAALTRQARAPIPPPNAPTCPPGQRLDPVGRCRVSGSGLGK